MTKRRAALFCLLVGLLLCAAAPASALETFEKDRLRIETQAGEVHEFEVELALNSRQWAQGLMFRRSLAPDAGMLFVYDGEAPRSMWMKNTYISLDMVFARADGSVASVAHDTEPLSLRSVTSSEPVNFVLELNAGTAARLWIDEDSRLFWEQAVEPN